MDQHMAGTGLPLLSGDLSKPDNYLPSDRPESSCRRCDKEFNILFVRSRTCNHCGYLYCNNCSDYQALAPRKERGVVCGYEPLNICAFCSDMLTITAASKSRLRTTPLSKLRDYMTAYNIQLPGGILEKEELINTIILTRERNGCLPKQNEQYYRSHSVPDHRSKMGRQSTGSKARNFWHRATGMGNESPRNNDEPPQQPRPHRSSVPTQPAQDVPYAPRQNAPPRPQQNANPRPQQNANPRPQQSNPSPRPRQASYTHGPQQNSAQPPPRQSYSTQGAWRETNRGAYQNPVPPRSPRTQPNPAPRPQFSPSSNSMPNPRPFTPPPSRADPPPPRPNTAPSQSPPRAPTPTLESLLSSSKEELSKLSIHHLKSVLFANHVNAHLAVEKSELVERLNALVQQEREERESARARQEQEEQAARERAQREDEERIRRQAAMMEEHRKRQEAFNANAASAPEDTEDNVKDETKANPPSSYATAERDGLCVICQDEDANIAIVDCGHLCLCRGCSQTIMNSTRECPMCRTRIITEARLLRIFKT